MESIVNPNILNQIQNHVFENDSCLFKLKGFSDTIEIHGFSIPSSLNDDDARQQLEKWKFKTPFHLLNTAYKKVGIQEFSEEDINENLQEQYEYWYLQIIFSTPIPKEKQTFLKSQLYNFFIFITEDGVNIDFKMMYSKNLFFDYVKEFSNAIPLAIEDIKKDQEELIVLLESVIYGACKKMNITIPDNINTVKYDGLFISTPDLSNFISLFKLVTRNNFDEAEYKKDAKKLQNYYAKGADEIKMHEKFRNLEARYETAYYSDWKFDAQNIEWAISEILGENFTFDYPKDTYSRDLFPYIQIELAKQNYELMNCDTFGDSYLFFVVNKSEVEIIIELAHKIGLNIEKL